jgi:hypothetical protein
MATQNDTTSPETGTLNETLESVLAHYAGQAVSLIDTSLFGAWIVNADPMELAEAVGAARDFVARLESIHRGLHLAEIERRAEARDGRVKYEDMPECATCGTRHFGRPRGPQCALPDGFPEEDGGEPIVQTIDGEGLTEAQVRERAAAYRAKRPNLGEAGDALATVRTLVQAIFCGTCGEPDVPLTHEIPELCNLIHKYLNDAEEALRVEDEE